jgi:hypothetical protein
MTFIYTVTTPLIFTAMLSLALFPGAQRAAAQEVLDAPPQERLDGPKQRPVPFRSLQQNTELGDRVKEKRNELRDQAREQRAEFRDGARNIREEINAEATTRRAEIQAEIDTASTPQERQAVRNDARIEREAMRTAALEKREAMRVRAKEMRDTIKEKRDELAVAIATDVGKRLKVHLERVLTRIANALETFVGISERINNKLAELEANGIETARAAAAASVAEQKIAEAADALGAARVVFNTMLESDTPRDYIEDVRAAIRNAIEAVQNAHRSLTEALQELKALTRDANRNAPSDAEATSDDDEA